MTLRLTVPWMALVALVLIAAAAYLGRYMNLAGSTPETSPEPKVAQQTTRRSAGSPTGGSARSGTAPKPQAGTGRTKQSPAVPLQAKTDPPPRPKPKASASLSAKPPSPQEVVEDAFRFHFGSDVQLTKVTVVNGVLTLEGTVAKYRQIQDAREVAVTALNDAGFGPILEDRVVNHLRRVVKE
jgi:hypothetical protein